jgi:hypothetical protein
MSTSQLARTRFGAFALAASGVLFVLYVAVRPWHDESTLDGAIRSMSSDAWVASHLFAMVAFILVPLGLLALRDAVSRTRGERLAHAAVVTSWIGAGLTLPYYGAEDFGLHALGSAARTQSLDLLNLADAVRFNPAAATIFAVGLLALGVGATLAAVAVWRSGVLPRFSGILFAVSFLLLVPQFYTPAAVRIGHGVLVAVAAAWLALAMWRVKATELGPRQGAA